MGLLIISQLLIVSLTIISIIYISIPDEQYKQFYPDDTLLKLMLQMKGSFKILIWFVAPLSLLIISINSYKLYLWIHEKWISRKSKNKKTN